MHSFGFGFFKISSDCGPAFPCNTLFLRPTGFIIIPLTPMLEFSTPVTIPTMMSRCSPLGLDAKTWSPSFQPFFANMRNFPSKSYLMCCFRMLNISQKKKIVKWTRTRFLQSFPLIQTDTTRLHYLKMKDLEENHAVNATGFSGLWMTESVFVLII